MKLKIISDGTNTGTKLIDEDTGEMVHGVQKLTWEVDAHEFVTKVGIEFFNIPVEIVSRAEVDLIEYVDQGTSWEPVHTKTFEKDIKIVSEGQNGKSVAVQHVKILNPETNESVSAVQSVKWEATPDGSKAKVVRIKFDKKDW